MQWYSGRPFSLATLAGMYAYIYMHIYIYIYIERERVCVSEIIICTYICRGMAGLIYDLARLST